MDRHVAADRASQIKNDRLADQFMVTAMAFVDAMHREQARERTRDALYRKAERGHVAGGVVYGYRNVDHLANGKRSHVTREIDPAQAEIVRRCFREVTDGYGYLGVAKRLNAARLPGPRGDAWTSSTVRVILFNELYRGTVIYGRTRWVDLDGTKRKRRVDDSREWVQREPDPTLQIVDAAL
jgi:DNA invertase Pin-like site-specific DNA recombinase